jgi:hypothetical protein
MVILSYLLRSSASWSGAELNLKLVVQDEQGAEAARRNLDETVGRLRIGARSHVLVRHDRPFREILTESSRDADLVFMGIAEPSALEDFTHYYADLQAMADDLPAVVFTLAAQDLPFADLLA